MEIESLELRSMDYVSDRNLSRRAGENISTPRAPRAGDDARPSQPEENLLDVVSRKAFLSRNLAPIYRSQIGPLGEVERANDAVLGPGSNPHAFRIGIRDGSDKGNELLELL
jgi:hypothetical protein